MRLRPGDGVGGVSGRTVWQAQDAAWWRRERVVLLGEEFGAEGPALVNWLECEAKAQNAGGLVKAGYSTAARGAFVAGGADRAREIVALAVEVGFLEDFTEGERTFTATIAAYQADQGTGRDSLTRSERRARASDTAGQDRTGPDMSADVRNGPAPVSETGEDRREPTSTPKPSVPLGDAVGVAQFSDAVEGRSSGSPPSPTEGGAALADSGERLGVIAGRLFDYWRKQCRKPPTAKFSPDRRRKVEARLREGYTEQQIRTAIDGAARAAFVNDNGKRFDDLELICRSGSKLESFIDSATATSNGTGRFATSRERVAVLQQRDAA